MRELAPILIVLYILQSCEKLKRDNIYDKEINYNKAGTSSTNKSSLIIEDLIKHPEYYYYLKLKNIGNTSENDVYAKISTVTNGVTVTMYNSIKDGNCFSNIGPGESSISFDFFRLNFDQNVTITSIKLKVDVYNGYGLICTLYKDITK